MMPPVTNAPAGKPAGKDDAARKTAAAARPQGEAAVKCPRCDSPNTKFCYYNNYSLTQPRHFCKTCRRYWTKGGALRNVPIGGGCRKNKKLKSSHRLSADSRDSSGSSDVGGLKFFQGLSPAMDFQLGGLNSHPSNAGLFNQFSNFGDLSSNSPPISANLCFNLESPAISSPGFTFPLSSSLKQSENLNPQLGFPEMGSMNVHSNLASSIEDLHWKLQQQRLATLFVEDNNQKENSAIPSGNIESLIIQKPQPILFQNLENSNSKPESWSSRKDCPTGNLSTELFFSNSYATAAGTGTGTGTSNNNLNDNSSSWSGYQAWSELAQYSSLP